MYDVAPRGRFTRQVSNLLAQAPLPHAALRAAGATWLGRALEDDAVVLSELRHLRARDELEADGDHLGDKDIPVGAKVVERPPAASWHGISSLPPAWRGTTREP